MSEVVFSTPTEIFDLCVALGFARRSLEANDDEGRAIVLRCREKLVAAGHLPPL